MTSRLFWMILVILVLAILVFYLWPSPHAAFNENYAKVDSNQIAALQDFRSNHSTQQIMVNNVPLDYVLFGADSGETILFLHGMTGAYDIWFQQMEALKDRFRVVSLSYPPVNSLEKLSEGVLAILDRESISKVNVVGTSLGGYLAQFLVATHPERISHAVFANTFPPNDILAEKNKTIGKLLPYLPEWLVLKVLRGSFQSQIYPSSGYDDLTLAYMLEQSYGRMTKAQVYARFKCVVEPFAAPDLAQLGIPVMIIEAGNDPLVENQLREQMKSTYPSAIVHTLQDVGHFPYLNVPEAYTQLLDSFFNTHTERDE